MNLKYTYKKGVGYTAELKIVVRPVNEDGKIKYQASIDDRESVAWEDAEHAIQQAITLWLGKWASERD